MSDLSIYGQYADKHNAAYSAFRRTYEQQTPPPIHIQATRDSLFVPAALVVIIGASVIVSGSRTIGEFGGGFIGVAAFFMLEMSIVAYAFFTVRRSYTDALLANSRKLAGRGLKVAFVVAMAANVHNVLQTRGAMIDSNLNTLINVGVAISAPVLAWISGDILAIETMANASRTRKADEDYRTRLAEWTAGLNGAWELQKAKWRIRLDDQQVTISMPVQPQLSAVRPLGNEADTDSGHATGQGYSKAPDARTKAHEYISANPESIALPAREFAELVGIGKSTAAEVLKAYRKANS